MTLSFVFGCFGMLVFFVEPLFSQQLTEGPIGTIKKEVYVKNRVRNKAPWVWTYSGEPGYREEIHTIWSHDDQVRGYGDSPTKPHRRVSHDDGKTWSKLTPLPPILTVGEKFLIIDWKFCGIYDPVSKRHVDLSIHHVRDMRHGPPRRIYNQAFNGLLEADVAKLGDGRVMVVWRVTKNGKEKPGREESRNLSNTALRKPERTIHRECVSLYHNVQVGQLGEDVRLSGHLHSPACQPTVTPISQR